MKTINQLLGIVKTTKADVSKKITPHKCELCGIGIGTSMLFFENTWREYQHINKEVHWYDWNGRKLKLCDDCFEDLQVTKDVDKYLKKNLSK